MGEAVVRRELWMNRLMVGALSGLLVLGACGSGDGPALSVSDLDYSNAAEERHSYAEYRARTHLYPVRRGDAPSLVYIGGDLEPREKLTHVRTENDIRFYMGASRDGVGVERLENYRDDLESADGTILFTFLSDYGLKPFKRQPSLVLDPDFLLPSNAGILYALDDSYRILNDALPPEFQIGVAGTSPTPIAYLDQIYVALESPDTIRSKCGVGAVACAKSRVAFYSDQTYSAVLYIPDDFDVSEYVFPRKLIVHELLHALGIKGHVDSVEFPDSIMGTSGEHIPNAGHIISKIDREVLQIMYMSQLTHLYNDWGEWTDTSFHLMGESEDGALRFGVALFNGLPQPWARGVVPDTPLADNTTLFGTATWNGALLAFSGTAPLAGEAEMQVNMSTLADEGSEHDLRFRDIFFVNRIESESPNRWFSARNIDYKITISDVVFGNVLGDGYEQGFVDGTFLGAKHEHMGGTVKRTDMVGAFGGSR